MSHYSARVEVTDGTLHVSRPLTAPTAVDELVESVRFDVVGSEGAISAVSVEVDTPDESEHPIADSVSATSSTPIGAHEDDGPTVDPLLPASAVRAQA